MKIIYKEKTKTVVLLDYCLIPKKQMIKKLSDILNTFWCDLLQLIIYVLA